MRDERPDETGPHTNFGYRQVPLPDKAPLVSAVFSSVASNYDVMNDLMSLGVHRLWKRYTVFRANLRPGHRALDLATGTGDLARLLARDVGPDGQVIVADINMPMLSRGRDRLIDAGWSRRIQCVQADAQQLPFADDYFDCITMAFGLRNVTDKFQALCELHRVLRPAGVLLVLEFSKPVAGLLSRAYDAYSFSVLPRLGKLVAGDADSYRYLAESIRMHPDQVSLKHLMSTAGLARVDYQNLSGGIVALHRGYKI
ncbi:MAG: bifunctional demethylmenaquinone methyltransferase/2-methoxy-6-polyprenyl-1,4-benzoquinol methylase UbiE [Gammaproteobacteria bacterium]|nr:bifunctional demethylmenaquinone methyltransferase/2-methoxy-6-polyprenyl-1,4-benzoquinol methylase UbiE [Gammaproteobacteria bacterium]